MNNTHKPKNAYQKIKVGDEVIWSRLGLMPGVGVVQKKAELGRLDIKITNRHASWHAILYAQDVTAIYRNGNQVF